MAGVRVFLQVVWFNWLPSACLRVAVAAAAARLAPGLVIIDPTPCAWPSPPPSPRYRPPVLSPDPSSVFPNARAAHMMDGPIFSCIVQMIPLTT